MNTEHSIIAQSDMRCACIFLGLTSDTGSELEAGKLQRALNTIQAARDLHVFRVAGATETAQAAAPGFQPITVAHAEPAAAPAAAAGEIYGIGRHNNITLQIQDLKPAGNRLLMQAAGVEWAIWKPEDQQLVRAAGIGGSVTGNGICKAGERRGVLRTFYPDGGS